MMKRQSGSTAQRLIDQARLLIMTRGYNGFSYADLADAVGIRKPSIHFHFPAKADLVCMVVADARRLLREQMPLIAEHTPEATGQLRVYTDYWRNCISDGSAPFCLAAILAADMPALPPAVATEVRGHFDDLTDWLARVLAQGAEQGEFRLTHSPREEADAFLAATYGAMLSARAFSDPGKFSAIVDAVFERLSGR